MARLLLTLGVALVAVAGLAAAAGVLAYGTGAPRDGRLEIAGLDREVAVAWDDSGRVWVEGPDEVALAAGLGYAHAADHGWTAALWRQAARGALAEWFGDSARAPDLHARALGFEALARRTYEALGPDDRAVLDAYARGAAAAFAEPGVRQGDPFIVADVVPGGWEPWDALAVERLHAYLAAPALAADSAWARAAAADTAVARFVTADSTFRAVLGHYGGGFDRAYVLDADSARRAPALVHQVSGGSSALPLLAPAVLRTPDRTTLALTVPGTLASPGGWTDGVGWSVLLGAPLRLEPYDGPKPPPVYSRIVERDGDETLLEVARDTAGLVLRAGTAGAARAARADTLAAATSAPATGTASAAGVVAGVVADSAAVGRGWRVRWRGFRVGTDLGAFRALRAGRRPAAFTLLPGDGLMATARAVRVLGSPGVAVRRGGVAFVAQDSLARYAVDALAERPRPDSLATDSTLARLDGDARDLASGWARGQVRQLIAALGARDSLDDVLRTPYAYLNGWDGAYRADGIAPSLFEWWLWAHRDYTGHLPDVADSLDVALLPSTLRIARAELRDRYGPVPTDWRWGHVQGSPTYPVLSARRSAAARRYRTPLGPPGGHPTAPLPGPSFLFETPQPGLAVWSLRTDLRTGVLTLRSPGMRPPAAGAVDLDEGPGGPVLTLDPSAPMPERRLVLGPAS